MDATGADVLPDLERLRGALERRRRDRPPVVRVLEKLLGLEMKMRQYEAGKRFCDAVVERGGVEALNRAWSSPEALPTWEELEALYASFNLPPSLPATASRAGLPIYADDGRQVGKATSHTWSPILKKYLVIASVIDGFHEKGMKLDLEHTVEFERRKVGATVVPTPFYDPERKRK